MGAGTTRAPSRHSKSQALPRARGVTDPGVGSGALLGLRCIGNAAGNELQKKRFSWRTPWHGHAVLFPIVLHSDNKVLIPLRVSIVLRLRTWLARAEHEICSFAVFQRIQT